MKNMKRILAVLLAAALTMPAFACGEKISGGDETSNNNVELSSSEDDSSKEGGDSNADAGNQDSGAVDSEEEDPDVVIDPQGGKNHMLSFETPEDIEEEAVVSTIRGEDGKLYVEKTDINGAVVTEANGEAKTEAYTGETNAAVYEKDYQPGVKTYQAFWLDISRREDFVFDGNLIELEAKIADDAPDGVYPVEVYFADLSNYSANQDENADKLKNVAFRPGYICINSDQPEVPALTDAMTLTPDTISAKPGDTVRLNLRVDNNPGLVAFVIRMHYDDKIMSIEDAGAGSDLGKRAKLTTKMLEDE